MRGRDGARGRCFPRMKKLTQATIIGTTTLLSRPRFNRPAEPTTTVSLSKAPAPGQRSRRRLPNSQARLLDESTVTLSWARRDALADTLRAVRREALLDPAPSAYARALQAVALLPRQALRKIVDLRYGTDCDLGVVLLRGTPIDAEIPCQPKPTRLWHEKVTSITEAMHLVAHAAIGTVPIS